MKNVTITLDETTLEAARRYARRHQISLDALIRDLLVRAVVADRPAAIAQMFQLMDMHPSRSNGRRWKRDDLHVR